jgi:TPR repeat protein
MVDQDLDSDAALPQQRRRSDEFAELAISRSFKPAAGGFIYRAPSAWFFRRAEHYLVTAEQRELILAALMPPVAIKPCPRWLVWVIAGGVAVSAIGLLAGPALLFADYPATGFLAGLGVLVATAIVSLRRVALRQRARLQPVLALAQPTNQRISLWSLASWSSVALSTPRQLLVAGAFNAFMALCLSLAALSTWQRHGLSLSDPGSFEPVGAVYFAGAALLNFGFALRGKPSATPKRITAPLAIMGAAALAVVLVASLGDRVQREFSRSGTSRSADDVRLRAEVQAAAGKGDAAAMNDLGALFLHGLGGPADLAKAAEWFEKAAAAGNSVAMANIGSLYMNGQGVTKDYAKARRWFQQSVDSGNAAAMANLDQLNSWLDSTEPGLRQDATAARDWYEQRASGNGAAMHALGMFHLNGWGVPRDPAVARDWYEKAAAIGNLDGMQNLAGMLDAGTGGAADYRQAAQWILRSAKLGHPWSRTVLLEGTLSFLTASTRTELKRELGRLGYYGGPIDEVWDADSRAALQRYLDAPV